jgi:hypothetical protein
MADVHLLEASLRLLLEDKLREVMAHRERYVTAWVAETGVLPSEAELVQTHNADGSITIRVQRQTLPPGAQAVPRHQPDQAADDKPDGEPPGP